MSFERYIYEYDEYESKQKREEKVLCKKQKNRKKSIGKKLLMRTVQKMNAKTQRHSAVRTYITTKVFAEMQI